MPSFGTLKADTLTHSTAGSLATNFVVNGSAKHWSHTNSAGTSVEDSFNNSSLTDTGTGQQTHNLTSSMSNAVHSPQFSVGQNYNQQWASNIAAGSYRTNNHDGSSYQDAEQHPVTHGDLA